MLVALVVSLILAGCGGQPSSDVQTVRGANFRFEAPAGWQVSRAGDVVTAANGPVDLVQVRTYMLLKPYRHALLAGAVRELDKDAAKLATGLRGKIVSRRTTRVAGNDARVYTVSYDGKQQEMTFVLDGSREFELICRRPAAGDDTPCRRLTTTFALST